MKITKYSLLFLVFFLGTVLPTAVCPEEDSDTALQVTELGNIAIESGSFNLKMKEQTVVFKDEVTARSEDLTIECDKLHVYYSESEGGDVEIERILATGSVKITRADGLSGTAEKAVYDLVAKKVTMTGQPEFKRGKDSWRGSSLTYDLRDGSIKGTDAKAVLDLQNEEGVLAGEQ
jgi:lipopolysaccharide transport protein LptA